MPARERASTVPRTVAGSAGTMPSVQRPSRFEASRYLGDKRDQRVYDLDDTGDELETVIGELMRSEQFASFAPDTLAEARNRGYRLSSPARKSPADG